VSVCAWAAAFARLGILFAAVPCQIGQVPEIIESVTETVGDGRPDCRPGLTGPGSKLGKALPLATMAAIVLAFGVMMFLTVWYSPDLPVAS
jgi:hypothetical protein